MVSREISFSFSLLSCFIEILDQYRICLSNNDQLKKVNRHHEVLHDKLITLLLSSSKPKDKYSCPLSKREAAYARKLAFQYFIVLLKQGLVINVDNDYYKLYSTLNQFLEGEVDEIKSMLNLLAN